MSKPATPTSTTTEATPAPQTEPQTTPNPTSSSRPPAKYKSRAKVKQVNYRFPVHLLELLELEPMNRSASVTAALMAAHRNPKLLAEALARRTEQPVVEIVEHRNAVTQDPRITGYVQELSKLTQLPIEQVVRLAIEAYVFKL